jgi:putative aldouronate transport system substrate-binding protein
MIKSMSTIVLVLIMATTVLFAEGQQAKDSEQTEAVQVNPMGTLPIVDEKVTMSVFTSTFAFNVEENAYTKWLEEQTNVHVDWNLVPADSLDQKRNLLLASGDLPDVFLSAGFDNPSLQMIYGGRGILEPINDLIDEYGANMQELFARYPNAESLITSVDGNIYGVPKINECYHCKYYSGRFWVYQPWLDTLGLDAPETPKEFREMLLAFKNQDPNGNGKADEIPLSAAMGRNYYNNDTAIDLYIMNAFVYDDAKDRLIIRNGKIEVVYDDPEWRDGLRFMNQLYDDGVLYQESFVQGLEQLKALGENEVPILGSAPAGHPARFTQYQGESGRFGEYKAIPPLKGTDGERIANYDPFLYVVPGVVVITKEANAPVAFRWADFQLGKEATLRAWLGRPGKEWEWAESGQVGIDGKQAVVSQPKDLYDQAQNVNWDQRAPNMRTAELRLGRAISEQERKGTIGAILHKASEELYEPYAAPESILVPPLWFTDEQSSELADLKTTLTSYWQESMAQFILGTLDINSDSDWDRYVKELTNIGLARYEELLNEAYQDKYK